MSKVSDVFDWRETQPERVVGQYRMGPEIGLYVGDVLVASVVAMDRAADDQRPELWVARLHEGGPVARTATCVGRAAAERRALELAKISLRRAIWGGLMSDKTTMRTDDPESLSIYPAVHILRKQYNLHDEDICDRVGELFQRILSAAGGIQRWRDEPGPTDDAESLALYARVLWHDGGRADRAFEEGYHRCLADLLEVIRTRYGGRLP